MTPAPILHVNAETTWRGGENQVFLLARGMHPYRPCAVACVPGSPLATRLAAAGVPTHDLPGDRGLRAVQALRKIIRTYRPALLHAHTSRAHQLCLMAVLGTSLPILVTRRVDFPLKRGPVARWKYGRRVTGFVAISGAIRDLLVAGGVNEHSVTVIPSGIDFSVIDAAPPVNPRQRLLLPADAQVVINVAALADHKDHSNLLRAWAQVEAQCLNAHLVIAGEGELRPVLEQLCHELRLNRAHLIGHREDVPGLLKGSDLFVMSSYLEGLCTSIMDAKRCGLPVVATRAGGIPEVVHDGIDGSLVAVRDPDSLAAAIAALLTDSAKRARFAASARNDSARFSSSAMVAAYLAFYGALLD